MATYGPTAISQPAGAIIIHPGDNVSAIVNSAPTGATFFFEAGVYRGVSLSPKEGQTFIGEQGAVLNGSTLLTNFTHEGSHWVIGGQTQEGFRNATDQGESGSMRAGYPETVYIDNKPLTPVDALSKLAPGKFYFDYAADKIYIGDNPAGHKVEAGTLDHAFEGKAKGVTVQNFVVEKYSNPVQTGAIEGNQSWKIIDNEVRLNYGAGMRADANSQMVGNFIHDNGQMGIGDYDHVKTNLLVEGNEIARNGWWSGIDVFWEGGGSKFKYTDGLIVRDNYSHDNKGFGLWTDINNINSIYENNVIVHNSGGGINHEISYHAIIRNNVLMGNGYQSQGDGWMWGDQIQIQNSSNVEVYGNKVDMTGAEGGNGIGLIQQNRGSGNHGPWVTTGNNIHDNIIVSKDGNGSVGGAADFNAGGLLNGGNVWKNNAYYMPSGDHFRWGNTLSFTEFKAATGETGTISQAYPNTGAWVTVNGAIPSDTGTGTSPGNTSTDHGTSTGSSGSGAAAGGTGTGTGDTSTDHGTSTGSSGSGAAAGGTGTGTGNTSTDHGTSTGSSGTDTAGNDPPQFHFVDGNHRANDLFGSAMDDVMHALRGSDRLAGGDGNDHLFGGRGNDILFGGAGNDEIHGGDGRDVIKGDAGSDFIYGGSGKDVLLLSGDFGDYTIDVRGNSVQFTHAGETDVVRGVEQFHFDDGTYVIRNHSLVQINPTNGLDALLAKATAWDALQAQHTESAQQTNTTLADLTLELASGTKPAAATSDPVPSTGVGSVDASAHVDHVTDLTTHHHDHQHHHIFG